jgi:hypothetical protein
MGRCFRIFFPDLAASACSGIHLSPRTTKFLIAAKLPIAPIGTGSFPVLGAGPVCSGGSRPRLCQNRWRRFDRAKYSGKADCRSILCKCSHQESPESKTENVVLCFYKGSANSGRSHPSIGLPRADGRKPGCVIPPVSVPGTPSLVRSWHEQKRGRPSKAD